MQFRDLDIPAVLRGSGAKSTGLTYDIVVLVFQLTVELPHAPHQIQIMVRTTRSYVSRRAAGNGRN